jgi:chemotaxis protein CheD
LKPGGYLFTGHSETLNGMKLPLTPVSHTVYKHSSSGGNAQKELPIVYLKPAELCITDKPSVVRTVLGSCLAVTMFNPRLRVSAICHALLPQPDQHDAENETPIDRLKYVNSVIPEMLAKLKEYGVEPNEIEVKMFGGADMLNSKAERTSNQPVGRLNILKATNILDTHGLRVSISDVGGTMGRKIFFYTHTGEVLLKRLRSGIFPQETI